MKDIIPIVGLKHILSFGKHEGEILENVIKADPYYVEWVIENTGRFTLNGEANKFLQTTLAFLNEDEDYESYEGDWGDYCDSF